MISSKISEKIRFLSEAGMSRDSIFEIALTDWLVEQFEERILKEQAASATIPQKLKKMWDAGPSPAATFDLTEGLYSTREAFASGKGAAGKNEGIVTRALAAAQKNFDPNDPTTFGGSPYLGFAQIGGDFDHDVRIYHPGGALDGEGDDTPANPFRERDPSGIKAVIRFNSGAPIDLSYDLEPKPYVAPNPKTYRDKALDNAEYDLPDIEDALKSDSQVDDPEIQKLLGKIRQQAAGKRKKGPLSTSSAGGDLRRSDYLASLEGPTLDPITGQKSVLDTVEEQAAPSLPKVNLRAVGNSLKYEKADVKTGEKPKTKGKNRMGGSFNIASMGAPLLDGYLRVMVPNLERLQGYIAQNGAEMARLESLIAYKENGKIQKFSDLKISLTQSGILPILQESFAMGKPFSVTYRELHKKVKQLSSQTWETITAKSAKATNQSLGAMVNGKRKQSSTQVYTLSMVRWYLLSYKASLNAFLKRIPESQFVDAEQLEDEAQMRRTLPPAQDTSTSLGLPARNSATTNAAPSPTKIADGKIIKSTLSILLEKHDILLEYLTQDEYIKYTRDEYQKIIDDMPDKIKGGDLGLDLPNEEKISLRAELDKLEDPNSDFAISWNTGNERFKGRFKTILQSFFPNDEALVQQYVDDGWDAFLDLLKYFAKANAPDDDGLKKYAVDTLEAMETEKLTTPQEFLDWDAKNRKERQKLEAEVGKLSIGKDYSSYVRGGQDSSKAITKISSIIRGMIDQAFGRSIVQFKNDNGEPHEDLGKYRELKKDAAVSTLRLVRDEILELIDKHMGPTAPEYKKQFVDYINKQIRSESNSREGKLLTESKAREEAQRLASIVGELPQLNLTKALNKIKEFDGGKFADKYPGGVFLTFSGDSEFMYLKDRDVIAKAIQYSMTAAGTGPNFALTGLSADEAGEEQFTEFEKIQKTFDYEPEVILTAAVPAQAAPPTKTTESWLRMAGIIK